MEIQYDPDRRILRVIARGPWPNGAGHAAVKAKIDALEIADDAGVLVDLRLVDPLTAPRFTQVAFRSERTMRGVPSRRAYLVNEGVQFGVARMIQSMAPEDVQLEVFTDEGAAVEWLTTHGPDPASSSALRPFE